jgi:hypothetical protein
MFFVVSVANKYRKTAAVSLMLNSAIVECKKTPSAIARVSAFVYL